MRRVILVPGALWLAGGILGIVNIWLTATLKTGDIVSAPRLAHTIIAFLAVTLVTNLLTTGKHAKCQHVLQMILKITKISVLGLIVWRIYQVDRETSKFVTLPRQKRSTLANAIRIIVESGLLYTIFVLLSLVTEVVGSNAADVVEQMVSILFFLAIFEASNVLDGPWC